MMVRSLVLLYSSVMMLALSGQGMAESEVAITPAEVLKNVNRLDGETVLVRGYLTFGFEDRNIWNSAKSRKRWVEAECVSLINYGSLDGWKRFSGKLVLLEAIVRRDADDGGSIIRLGSCNQVALELIESKPPRIVQQ